MINKIPMGINNIDQIIEKLREVIDAVNPVIELHKAGRVPHRHKQFHSCPKCGHEYFIRLSSCQNYAGYTELLQCSNCNKRIDVQGFSARRYEVSSME